MKHIKSILAAGALLATGLAGTAAQAQDRNIGEVYVEMQEFELAREFCEKAIELFEKLKSGAEVEKIKATLQTLPGL